MLLVVLVVLLLLLLQLLVVLLSQSPSMSQSPLDPAPDHPPQSGVP